MLCLISQRNKISGLIWLRRGTGRGSCIYYNRHTGSKNDRKFLDCWAIRRKDTASSSSLLENDLSVTGGNLMLYFLSVSSIYFLPQSKQRNIRVHFRRIPYKDMPKRWWRVPCINLGTTWRGVVSFTPRPFIYTVPTKQEFDRAAGPFWVFSRGDKCLLSIGVQTTITQSCKL
jgi:hypothetical protein